MDLAYTDRELAFRDACRAWLEANVPTDPGSQNTALGFARHVAWERALFAAGWAVPSWPRAWGGREASLIEWLIFEEEYYRANGPPRVTQNGIFLLAPTLFEHGTPEQQERLLRPMAAAETLWAQAWSEPGAGSDLASVRCTGRRVEGGWRVTGQKTWSTRACFCHAIHGLFRTDPASERHRGLTYLLVALDQPGVTVRPILDLAGEPAFAEVFLDDAFVPDADVVGPVNGGWKVAMSTTSSERGLTLRSPGRFLAATDRLLQLYRERPDPRHRDTVVDVWIRARAYRDQVYETATRMRQGHHPGAESSLAKLCWSELDVALHETALALLGPDAERAHVGWSRDHLFSLAGPIYAGTNEIQRNIVAQRVLGLPAA